MKNLLARVALAATLICGAAAAHSAVIFSEDFNSDGFAAGTPFLSFSDRLGNTRYQNIAAFRGWSFAGQNFLATKVGTADSAVLMNEGPLGSLSHALNGLVVGESYTLEFLLSGDNIPGGGYGLETYIGDALVLTSFGVDANSGQSAGSLKSVSFTAQASSTTLRFQARHPLSGWSAASPMIDNVVVSNSAVPEPASMALVGIALLGMGAASRRKRA